MLGRVGIALSMYDDAISYLQRYSNQTQQPPDLAIVKGYLGVAYARVGGWNRAMQAAQEGLELAEGEGSSQAIAFARMQLGFVYADLQKWELAQKTIRAVPDPLEGHYPANGSLSTADPLQLTPVGFMLLGLRHNVLDFFVPGCFAVILFPLGLGCLRPDERPLLFLALFAPGIEDRFREAAKSEAGGFDVCGEAPVSHASHKESADHKKAA